MKKHNDLSDTPITQADIDNGKLKLVKRDAAGAVIFDRVAFVQSLNNNKQPKTDSVIEMMRKNERY
jgi:hypothetical protein